MSTLQDFRNLVGGDNNMDSGSQHARTDSDLTDELLKSRSSVLNLSFKSNRSGDDISLPNLNIDVIPSPLQTSSNSEQTGSCGNNNNTEVVDSAQTAEPQSRSPFKKKHYRDHSYTRRSFDATFKQFEGRYKTYASFSPQHGVIKSEVVHYEELSQAEQKKTFLKLKSKKVEKVGTAQMILHGSCLYFFRQDRASGEESESARAVFILDHCEYQVVPTEESTEAALDILPGGQQKLRIYLNSEENRFQWLMALQESSPYHSADLITEARQEIMRLQTELEQSQTELEATQSQCRYLQDSQEAMRKEFEAEKEDYEEQFQMLQDEQRVQRQLKNTQQGEFHATVQERDEMEEQLQKLIKQRDLLREERVALRRHCQKMENEIREVKQGTKDKDRDFRKLQKQLTKQVEVVEKLKGAAENFKAQAKEMPEWRKKAKEMESINREMEEDIGILEEELQVVLQDKADIEDASRRLENQVNQLLKERDDQEVYIKELSNELDRATVYNKSVSKASSSTNNSTSTREVHQQRWKSDSLLETSNIDFFAMLNSEDSDVASLQKRLATTQNKLKHTQMMVSSKEQEILLLQHRAAAFDTYMSQVSENSKKLEGEIERLNLKMVEMKRLGMQNGVKSSQSAPMDPEMLKGQSISLYIHLFQFIVVVADGSGALLLLLCWLRREM
eukprot:TRINITY_DN19035_c0_g1_i1.p1 TRINITY_DN19035_c0_g1~~TRINITY_DN19035_c0_g1_i1.p1  ORF type:complete len:675 (-),score=93.97 TRINITY_DN19035_c0_g1_i1:73-2097(-)